MSIQRADLQAALDVVQQLTEEIDDLDAAQAIEMRTEIDALQRAAKLCHELLTSRTLTALDGQPVIVGSKVYAAKAKGKWRVDHRAIRAVVHERSMRDAIDANGEVVPAEAARKAVEMMYELFVSPADFPKQGGLKNLGLTNKHVGVWEHTGAELKVMDLGVDDE